MADDPTFDMEQLLNSTNDDRELAGQVVEVFLSDIPAQLSDLDKALSEGDAKTAERIAHSIKGASATVGGKALREVAYACEMLGHNGDIGGMKAKLPGLREQCDRLCEALKTAFDN